MQSPRLALAVALASALLVSSAAPAAARPRPGHASNFHANKTFGLGVMLGAPSGLSGKYFLTDSTALDFGIGTIDHYYANRNGLHLHLDYLVHPLSLVSAEAFELPLYVGIGGRLWDFDYNRAGYTGRALGLRVPLGIAFDFNNVPLDIFVEVAFVLDFYNDYYANSYGTDVNGAIGIRYWFK
jgi:hypothetical protein